MSQLLERHRQMDKISSYYNIVLKKQNPTSFGPYLSVIRERAGVGWLFYTIMHSLMKYQ